VLQYSALSGLSFVFLIPLFWMMSTSLKTTAQTWVFPPQWVPNPVKWENFADVFRLVPFWLFIRNTLIVVFWNILGQGGSTSLVAYGFARLRFPGRATLFILMIATLMIPYQVTLIPTFLLFKELGWINTYLPLTVPAFTGSAFFIFLVRQYMMTIPTDLDEAARIDGCGYFQVLYRILLPLCKPPLTIVVVFTFVGVWNDFLGPLIYLNDVAKYTIGVGLSLFRGRVGTNWNVLMAASLMAVLPSLVLYFSAQNRLIGGIASVGIKG
jgi:ABC-type glycerol-3-phosphate transport system permease component